MDPDDLEQPDHSSAGGSDLVPCGTKRAYQRHLNRGEEPDERCKQANREYTQEFDRRTGNSRARNRAFRRLARSFPDVFEALLTEERHRTISRALPPERLRSRLRERAYRRLAKLYPDIYQRMLTEEKSIARREAESKEAR